MQPFVHVGCLLRLACSSLVLCRPKTVSPSTPFNCYLEVLQAYVFSEGLELKRLYQVMITGYSSELLEDV